MSRNIQSFILAIAMVFAFPLSLSAVDCSHEYVYSQNPDGSYRVYCQICNDEVNPDHCILYTTTDDQPVELFSLDFGSSLLSNTINNGKGVLYFDGDVTRIGSYLFYDDGFTECFISSIVIPNKVTHILECSFLECYHLSSVIFGKSVQEIGKNAFAACTGLSGSLILPESLKRINIGAFSNCDYLTNFELHSIPYVAENSLNPIASKLSLVLSDNSYIYPSVQPGIFPSITNFSYSVSLSQDWNSCVLPFAVSSNEDVQLYELETMADASHIMVSPVDVVAANTPFIFKRKSSDVREVTLTLSAGKVVPPTSSMPYVDTKISGYRLFANYDQQGIAEGSNNESSYYLLNGDTFTKQNADFDVPAFGVYLQVPEGTATSPSSLTISDQHGVIYYTSTDGNIVTPSLSPSAVSKFGANLLSNTYSNGKGTLLFDGPVTKIGSQAFRNNNTLETIDLPSTITYIDDAVFSLCSSLRSLRLPEGITTIPQNMCYNCTSLEEVYIPSSVRTLKNVAFWGCNNLTSVTIPEGVTTIPNGFFNLCYKLNSVTLPSTLTTIEASAFTQDTSLVSIIIPAGVTSIGKEAFYNCKQLRNINIPSGVTRLESKTFSYCRDLSSITLHDGITSIGTECFSNSGLRSITINGITELANKTFYGCDKLATVNLPNVETVGDDAFSHSSSRKAGLQTINMPKVHTVGDRAFKNCYQLTSFVFPELANIGTAAFHGTGLNGNLDLAKIARIGDQAFYNTQVKNVSVGCVPMIDGDEIFTNINSKLVMNLDDNIAVLTSNDNYTCRADISYTRNMSSNWGTAVFPFVVRSNEQFSCYTLESAEQDVMNFVKVDEIPANTPFVYRKLDEEASSVAFTATQFVAPYSLYPYTDVVSNWQIQGTYLKLTNQQYLYFLSHDAYYYAEDPITIKPFRSFFIECVMSLEYSASGLRIQVVDGETTSLFKMTADGGLKEIQSEAITDLQGHQLSAPVKGQMNIVGGKKMILK